MAHLFIFGLGYSAKRIRAATEALGWRVTATGSVGELNFEDEAAVRDGVAVDHRAGDPHPGDRAAVAGRHQLDAEGPGRAVGLEHRVRRGAGGHRFGHPLPPLPKTDRMDGENRAFMKAVPRERCQDVARGFPDPGRHASILTERTVGNSSEEGP